MSAGPVPPPQRWGSFRGGHGILRGTSRGPGPDHGLISPQRAQFPPQTAQYVRLEATAVSGGGTSAIIGEVAVGSTGATSVPGSGGVSGSGGAGGGGGTNASGGAIGAGGISSGGTSGGGIGGSNAGGSAGRLGTGGTAGTSGSFTSAPGPSSSIRPFQLENDHARHRA